jgi:hypothetical protein
MPFFVNGQLVTDERVGREELRIARDPQWQSIVDEAERAKRLRAAAEFAAVDVMLVEQIAAGDPRPVDAALMEQQLRMQRSAANCLTPDSNLNVRRRMEWNLACGIRGGLVSFVLAPYTKLSTVAYRRQVHPSGPRHFRDSSVRQGPRPIAYRHMVACHPADARTR